MNKKSIIKWPGNKKFAVCLSHDGDVVFKYNLIGTLKEIKNNPKEVLPILYKFITKNNPYWQFDNIIKLEEIYGFR